MSEFEEPEAGAGGLFSRIGGAANAVGSAVSSAPDLLAGMHTEGLGAARDAEGLVDRVRARRELAGSFRVLGDATGEEQDAIDDAARRLDAATTERSTDEAELIGTLNGRSLEDRARILAAYEARTGETLDETTHRPGSGLRTGAPALNAGFTEQHNVLTPEQYERVVKLYSDIRLGRTDLKLAGGDGQTSLLGDIRSILQTESGRGLIRSLAEQPDDRITHIEPLGPHATAGDAFARQDTRIVPGVGEEAAGSTVVYRPGVTVDLENDHAWNDMRSDRVLYHELVHAHHITHGTEDLRPLAVETGAVPSDDGTRYPNTGEKAGELITNTEYQATGIGQHRTDRFSENRYGRERLRLGATNHGERHGDDDQAFRDRYVATRRPLAKSVLRGTLTALGHYAD